MGVRITDSSNVALYDSVTGLALGAVFEDETDAEAFLEWARAQKDGKDIRTLTPLQLATWRVEFEAARV